MGVIGHISPDIGQKRALRMNPSCSHGRREAADTTMRIRESLGAEKTPDLWSYGRKACSIDV